MGPIHARRSELEHPVLVGRSLRHWLHDVPVLHHLAALDAQDIDDGDAAVALSEFSVGVDRHKIAVRDYPLD